MTGDWSLLNALGLASYVVLWIGVLFLAFLLLGTLRSLGLLRWRLEQLEATTPSRLGRRGLRLGKKAPDFSLPSVSGGEIALHDFGGRQVLLVFTQAGCAPCQQIVPELNRLHESREHQVLVVNNSGPDVTRKWVSDVNARFPVVMQEGLTLSRRYEVFATPFAFLIDENGVIRSKGIINNRQHIGFVLSGSRDAAEDGDSATDSSEAEQDNPAAPSSTSNAMEAQPD
jgi:methylamine dehydrogenase accessory protein MauD